jgi:hypothetical protein
MHSENSAPEQQTTAPTRFQTSGRPARRVHFSGWRSSNDSNNHQPILVKQLGPLLKPASDMKRKEKIELWYQDTDVRAFRQEAMRLAYSISIKERYESKEIDVCNPMSYSNVHGKIYEAANSGKLPARETMKYLENWHKVAVSRRGLERWSLPTIALDRMSRIDATIKKVLSLQETMDDNIFDAEERTRLLRCASEQMSRPSKRLAQILARADEVAANTDNQMKILHNALKRSISEELLQKKLASTTARRNSMPLAPTTSASSRSVYAPNA